MLIKYSKNKDIYYNTRNIYNYNIAEPGGGRLPDDPLLPAGRLRLRPRHHAGPICISLSLYIYIYIIYIHTYIYIYIYIFMSI